MAPTPEQMKAALQRLYDESNKGNVDVMDELLTEDFVSYGGAGFQDLHGREAFKQLFRTFKAAMPDLHFGIYDLIAEGNKCVVYGPLQGTHRGNFMGFAPPTNKLIKWTGIAIFRFNDEGKIDARWQEWDGLGVLTQMGVIPPIGGPAKG